METVAGENLGIAHFAPHHVGHGKAEVIARDLEERRPSLSLSALNADVSMIGPAAIDTFDLVSAAVDNDKAAYTISRIVALSKRQPAIVFANCDPVTGSAQVRIVNFRVNRACIGCSRSQSRWSAPLSTPHSCTRGARRATAEAAQFAAALQISIIGDLLRSEGRQWERAGESILIDPHSGRLLLSHMTFNENCPATYHFSGPEPDNTLSVGGSIYDVRLGQLLEAIANRLGERGFIDLGERWCCRQFLCAACGKEDHTFRLIDAVPHCPCGHRMNAVGGSRRIDVALRHTAAAEASLSDCGFAEGDVLPAVSSEGFCYVSLDLSSDWVQKLNARMHHASA
jgi:hypothetical protein